MKIQNILLVLFICVLGCKEDEEPDMEQIRTQMETRIKANAALIDESMKKTKTLVGTQNINALRDASATTDSFIAAMYALDKGSFDEGMSASRNSLGLGEVTYPFTNRAYLKLREYLEPYSFGAPTSPDLNIINLYSKEVDDSLARAPQQEIEIISFSWEATSSGAHHQPMNISYSFTTIRYVKDQIAELILTYPDESILDQKIQEFAAAQDTQQGILIGLLIPAVQKVRSGTDFQKLHDLLFGLRPAQESKAWIQKVRYLAFLASVDFLISKEFDGRDENYASIGLNREVCHAVTVLTWARVDGVTI